jgi:hypothetical protein
MGTAACASLPTQRPCARVVVGEGARGGRPRHALVDGAFTFFRWIFRDVRLNRRYVLIASGKELRVGLRELRGRAMDP